jgi:opacity protein-like surface antigen
VGFATFTTASISPLSTNGAFPALNGRRLGLQSGGVHDLFTATVNAFYDLPIHGPYVPYLGAGFGLAHEVVDDAHFAGFTQFGSDTTNPVVLGEVGLTVRATEQWEVVPAYRFEHVFQNRTFDAHILKLGVRYRF